MNNKIDDAKVFKYIDTYDSLTNIIASNVITKRKEPNIRITKKETMSLASDYFNDNSSFYSLLPLNKIAFRKNSSSSFLYDSQKIIIEYTKTLEDLFSLVHESTHKLLYKDNQEDIYKLFNELIAFYSELELCDYLQNSDLWKESKKQIYNSINYIYLLNKDAKFESNLYKSIKSNEKIDLDTFNYYVNHRNLYNNVGLDIFGKYMFSVLMGIYINEKITSKEELKKLKKALISLNYDDIKSILQLDIYFKDGLYIEKNSIDEISKTYKKGIKKYE